MLNSLLQPLTMGNNVPALAKYGFVLLLMFAVLNFSVGIYQAVGNHGDLDMIKRHNEFTLYSPEIYKDENNVHSIRYPINSAVVLAPVFAFYVLDDTLVYYYLLLMLVSLFSLPWLLIYKTRINSDIHKSTYLKIILIILMATAATRATLNTGQLGIIFFSLFLLSYQLVRQHPKVAAILLAIAICKPQMGLFFLIFMLLNGYYLTSLLATSIHVFVHVVFCYLNDLNVMSTVVRWLKWQMQFSDHAINDNAGYINSMHSIDMINIARSLSLPNEAVLSVFILFLVAGLILLYLCRDNKHAQLAVLCIWPLFLFYHRPYDYFLIWGIIPLLLQNRDNVGLYGVIKLMVITLMLLPYIPTFSVFADYVALREVFYLAYTVGMVFVLLSIYPLSRRNLAAGYT